jgi:peroxiredoxin
MGIFDHLDKGSILPALYLAGWGSLSALPGRRSLLLFLAHPLRCAPCVELLRELAANYGQLRETEAEVLALVPGTAAETQAFAHRLALPFPVCAVRQGQFGRDATVIVTDRFGEVFAVAQAGATHRLLTVGEIFEELAFIGVQCPE